MGAYMKKRINVRAKGHTWERYIANLFKAIGYSKAHRQLEFQINNALGIDIAETGRYKIQCKKTAKYVPMNTINEVKHKGDEIPILIAAGNSEPPLVTMHLHDFLELVSNNISDQNVLVRNRSEVLEIIKRVKAGGANERA